MTEDQADRLIEAIEDLNRTIDELQVGSNQFSEDDVNNLLGFVEEIATELRRIRQAYAGE